MKRVIKKVFVGMSGGVDSSVAALLLQKQGYEVVGVFIKSWDGLATSEGLRFREQCRSKEDRRDAISVAAKLKIPFITYDFSKAYQSKVIDYFFREHAAGLTPNPDIMCNKEIKFKLFLEKALSDGADYIATGHYARKSQIPPACRTGRNPKSQIEYQLLQGRDKTKDQSYFLYTLGQHELKHSLFPIGDYTKIEIRKMANKAGFVTAKKPDSQGICFVGEVPINIFLKARIPKKEGEVVTTTGRLIGRHDGVAFYTIGQRHGLRLSSELPYYVARKEVVNNVVVVAAGNDDSALFSNEVNIHNISWVGNAPQENTEYTAVIRYRQPPQKVKIKHISNGTVACLFSEPQRAVTPGQSLVLYDNERVLGGGVIK